MLKAGDKVAQRYELVELLGSGGQGSTWRAVDTKTQQRVALKALSMRSAESWKAIELFEREVRVLKALQHPNIPRYIDDVGLQDPKEDHFCLVQELVEGQSLAEQVKGGWRPDEDALKALAETLLETLTYLHKRSPPVIHRDIKPHNIIIKASGGLALVDFGAVKDTTNTHTHGGSTMVGTYGYMAPEQLRGEASPSNDLYALGTTLAFVLTARDPAQLPQKRLKIDFRAASNPSLALAAWLDRLIEPAPEDRFTSAQQALDALRRLDEPPTRDDDPRPTALHPKPPHGSRIQAHTKDGRLNIALPAVGVGGMDGQKIGLTLFGLFWLLGGISTMIMAGAPLVAILALFIPALIGMYITAAALLRIFGSQKLMIDAEDLQIQRQFMGSPYQTHSAKTDHVGPITTAKHPDFMRHTHSTRLQVGVQTFDIGRHLTEAENVWLTQRIQSHLDSRNSGLTLPSEDHGAQSEGQREASKAQETQRAQAEVQSSHTK